MYHSVPGTFVPLNTQATVVSYDAIWSLVLPASFHSRTIDIMRGFWLQPLLWLLGQHVGYYPAVSKHIRNPHDLLRDAKAEHGYYVVEDLVQALSKWSCSGSTLAACMLDLCNVLVLKEFWEQSDCLLIDAWLSDLDAIGYGMPKLPGKIIN